MARRETRVRITLIRENRMWTQERLAAEAGVSPTTISGIESGRISRPQFGTVKKLARALGVAPQELLFAPGHESQMRSEPLSLGWAMSSEEEEFEESLEGATFGSLLALSRELEEENKRLRRLYGEVESTEQRRLVKRRIREVAAQQGSVEASIAHHPDLAAFRQERSASEG